MFVAVRFYIHMGNGRKMKRKNLIEQRETITAYDEMGNCLVYDEQSGELIEKNPQKFVTPVYDQKLGDGLCSMIAQGESLPSVCEKLNIPLWAVQDWARNNQSFKSAFDSAKKARSLYDSERFYETELKDLPTMNTKNLSSTERGELTGRLSLVGRKQDILQKQIERDDPKQNNAPSFAQKIEFNCVIPDDLANKIKTRYTPVVTEDGNVKVLDEK